ncbi:hypothetical protein CDD83_3139 [Cordyceps sp. RAO-2017]|nr:hypothetical protein CDD83_3139 [Cordyceps sp. RAO-2017]
MVKTQGRLPHGVIALSAAPKRGNLQAARYKGSIGGMYGALDAATARLRSEDSVSDIASCRGLAESRPPKKRHAPTVSWSRAVSSEGRVRSTATSWSLTGVGPCSSSAPADERLDYRADSLARLTPLPFFWRRSRCPAPVVEERRLRVRKGTAACILLRLEARRLEASSSPCGSTGRQESVDGSHLVSEGHQDAATLSGNSVTLDPHMAAMLGQPCMPPRLRGPPPLGLCLAVTRPRPRPRLHSLSVSPFSVSPRANEVALAAIQPYDEVEEHEGIHCSRREPKVSWHEARPLVMLSLRLRGCPHNVVAAAVQSRFPRPDTGPD